VKKISSLAGIAILYACVVSAQDYPRVETLLGYTFTRANSASNVPGFSANGGSGQLDINASKHFGFVMDLGAVHNGNLGGYHLDSTFSNFLFGPRISFRHSRVTPYFSVLFGGVHAGTSFALSGIPVATNLPVYPPGSIVPVQPGQAISLRATASQTAFAMTTGIGLDIKLSHHVSFRLFDVDYYLTRLQNFRTLNDNNQHNFRLTTGLNFTFGGEAPTPPPPPAPPPMRSCWDGSSVHADAPCPLRTIELHLTAAQTELCPPASITVQFPGAPGNAAYQWTIEGQPAGTAATLDFSSAGREPGDYKVGVTVNAPDYREATAAATLTVRAYRPPSGTLDVSPREILVGEKAALSANFTAGQCGGPLGPPVFSASEGSISGNQFDSSGVRFDPAATSEQRKTVTLVAKVSDGKGEGVAQATVVVKKQSLARRLPDIVFPNANARVNNCGKRVLLEELKAAIDSDPTGRVVLVGHVSEKEAGHAGLDQKRALNAAAVISAGQGVCSAFPASQILIGAVGAADTGVDYQSHFCGSTQELPGSLVKESESDARFRRVEVWFIPSGAALPASLQDHKDAVSLSVSALGCPR
jgi:hypothetical protein